MIFIVIKSFIVLIVIYAFIFLHYFKKASTEGYETRQKNTIMLRVIAGVIFTLSAIVIVYMIKL